MPYASEKQARFIHAKAAEGEEWAKKFVRDADGVIAAVKRGRRRKRRRKR